MTWTPSGQITNAFANSPFARTLTVHDVGGVTLGTFTGLFLHTKPNEPPKVYAPRTNAIAKAVLTGETITATGYSAYVVEGSRSDGAYLLEFRLRSHVRAS